MGFSAVLALELDGGIMDGVDKKRDDSRPISEKVGQVIAAIMSEDLTDIVSQAVESAMAKIVEIEAMQRKELLTEDEVSKLYSVPVPSLRSERSRGIGPDYVKDGRRVLYPKKELDKYYHSRLIRQGKKSQSH